MTFLKRKLLSILAAPFPGINDRMAFSKLSSLISEKPSSIAVALTELEEAKLITTESRDEDYLYSVTPAGRAALIPERSV